MTLKPQTPRRAARVILLDPDGRALLFRFLDPVRGSEFWITPGGGLQLRESFEQAARRELAEETGIVGLTLSRCVWERTAAIRYGHRAFDQYERFFVAHAPRSRQSIRAQGREEYERTDLAGFRWWPPRGIADRPDLRFAPVRLAELLRCLPEHLAHGPDDPIDISE